ncbi:MAG: hypothetical protein HYV27_01545 [Candidatus Hydrogenedentes bacterium]|nr:hypothetical protein [Candidatus Hydrogenedentota bacterium]
MKMPSRDEQRQLVKQREETERLLEDMRRKELRGKPYDWREVDALLQLGEGYDGPPRFAEGMVEMQRLFTALARKKGWL